jgi:peptidoglycan hydrolase CwlO-like protein
MKVKSKMNLSLDGVTIVLSDTMLDQLAEVVKRKLCLDAFEAKVTADIEDIESRLDGSDLESKTEELDSKVDDFESKTEELDSKVDDFESKLDDLESKINAAESSTDGVRKLVRALRNALTVYEDNQIETE